MKYIVIQTKTDNGMIIRDIPIIFPDELTHSVISEVISNSIIIENETIIQAIPVSAGFYNAINAKCYGRSISLKLSSREEDTGLIRMNDYFHGLKI